MDRKAPPWRPVRLRWERLRDFSDSLSRRPEAPRCYERVEETGRLYLEEKAGHHWELAGRSFRHQKRGNVLL